MSIYREMRKAVQNAHLGFWELAVPYICYAATNMAVASPRGRRGGLRPDRSVRPPGPRGKCERPET
jgi:hypothetical protein